MKSDLAEVEGAACIANISPRERRRRLLAGAIQLAVTLVGLAALLASGRPRWWRLGLLPLFWAAGSGFFQWREST